MKTLSLQCPCYYYSEDGGTETKDNVGRLMEGVKKGVLRPQEIYKSLFRLIESRQQLLLLYQ